jgi:alkaline phosphatase
MILAPVKFENKRIALCGLVLLLVSVMSATSVFGQQDAKQKLATDKKVAEKKPQKYQGNEADFLRKMQFEAVENKSADWIHWGDRKDKFSNWTNHSNRLIPVYTYGVSLKGYRGKESLYRSKDKLKKIYGVVPKDTYNRDARYLDQTDIYHLQQDAVKSGKKNIILIVCDGMDWQTTQAASIYKNQKVTYTRGQGEGLAFLDYRATQSSYGYMVTSPYAKSAKFDVNSQVVESVSDPSGGYSSALGGKTPWSEPADPSYLLGKSASKGHSYTDSASSATSMTTGKKTFNGSINVGPEGDQLTTIAHQLQEEGFAIGVVSSVPICHATPAAAYAHNVNRSDYQDISRDLLGLRSVAHRKEALQGVDVLIGGGWGEVKKNDTEKQGTNFVPGNPYLAQADLNEIDVDNGGDYFVVQRHAGENGAELLADAALLAATDGNRLFGFFGDSGGHLPFQTADGAYDPTRGISRADRYEKSDVSENPTLANIATAALEVLESRKQSGANKGMWLMVESGDIDWANHNNNLDDAIGAVLSADEAFSEIVAWVEKNSNWEETALIMTADHGHMMVLDDLKALIDKK